MTQVRGEYVTTFYDHTSAPSSDMLVGSTLGWSAWIALIILGVALWVALARSSLVHGGTMERSDRVPQLYGYSVCLIAIVVILANVSSIANRSFTLANPLASSGPFGWAGVAFTSFEAYKATMDRERFAMGNPNAQPVAPTLTDTELRARYEALRADQIARVNLEARRDITESALMLVLAIGLFAWHWRWVRRGPATSS